MDVLYLYYSKEENIFYDGDGRRIDNIFELIRPNDLYLFRIDPGHNFFPYIHEKKVWCEIVDLDDHLIEDDEFEEIENPWVLELEMARNRWGIGDIEGLVRI